MYRDVAKAAKASYQLIHIIYQLIDMAKSRNSLKSLHKLAEPYCFRERGRFRLKDVDPDDDGGLGDATKSE
jgi:hypothetical protein